VGRLQGSFFWGLFFRVSMRVDGDLDGSIIASSQALYPSPRRKRQGSLTALLLLSPCDPLRWARMGRRVSPMKYRAIFFCPPVLVFPIPEKRTKRKKALPFFQGNGLNWYKYWVLT